MHARFRAIDAEIGIARRSEGAQIGRTRCGFRRPERVMATRSVVIIPRRSGRQSAGAPAREFTNSSARDYALSALIATNIARRFRLSSPGKCRSPCTNAHHAIARPPPLRSIFRTEDARRLVQRKRRAMFVAPRFAPPPQHPNLEPAGTLEPNLRNPWNLWNPLEPYLMIFNQRIDIH